MPLIIFQIIKNIKKEVKNVIKLLGDLYLK